MDRLKKPILQFLILIVLAGLIIGFRSFLMDYIIQPISLLSWLIWRFIASVNQSVYWIVLIVICIFLVVRLATSGRKDSPSLAYGPTYKPPNRVEHWQTLIDEAVLGRAEREHLRDNLQMLLMTVTQDEFPDTTNSEDIFERGVASLPPAARHYLFPSDSKYGMFFQNEQRNSIAFVPRWLRRWGRKYMNQKHTMIDEIASWMEAELEIHDGN